MRRAWLQFLLVVSLIVIGTAVVWGPAYARGASFVIRAAQIQGFLLDAAKVDAQPFTVGPIETIPTRHGAIRSRLYEPDEHIRRAVVLVPGVHALGIDEPRLTAFSGELAASGVAVATIEVPDLMRYQFGADAVDMIEDASVWLSGQSRVTPSGIIGLVGISFAGGLAIVAAGRPGIRDRLAFVFSLGGHGDLPRALRYLCTGREPPLPDDSPGAERRFRAPHDYGVAIILLGLAERMVPKAQVDPLRRGILTFLRASQLDAIDKAKSAEVFEEARQLATSMPEPAATLLQLVNRRDVAELGARLLPVLETVTYPASLSPERSPPPTAPVFLLHGTDDNVIPSVETVLLADHLDGKTDVRYLLSDLITHASADRPPGPGDVMRLVGFWADVLDE